MFEGLVAGLLNKYLGRYIQNLDADQLNLSIFSGNVELTDLKLKPEALFELDLPIEVKAGYVGKIALIIPWTSLYSLPVIATLEDVFVLAGPVTDRGYDEAKERALQDAVKKKILEDLESTADEEKAEEDQGFFDKLAATIINNIQVHIRNIHVRYEDTVTNPDHPFAFGITLQGLSAETTDSKWQLAQLDASANIIHKLMKLDCLAVYWNPYLPEAKLVRSKIYTSVWQNLLKKSIESKNIFGEEFDYIIQPVSAEAKAIVNKSDVFNSTPKILVDFVLEEIDAVVSRQQFLNMLSLSDSFKLMALNQKYRKYSPGVPIKGNASAWWMYAYTSVVEEYVRPKSWERIIEHRKHYKKYILTYKQKLENPKSDYQPILEMMERKMNVASIILAREQAKLEFIKEAPERARRKRKEAGWWGWLWGGGESDEEVEIEEDESKKSILSTLTDAQKAALYKGIGYDKTKPNKDIPMQYVEHKINATLKESTLSLCNYGKEVLKLNVSNLFTTFENRPAYDAFRVTGKTASFSIEGASVEHELVSMITSGIGVYPPSDEAAEVFKFDFDQNPYHVKSDYAVSLSVQPVEIVYDHHAITEVIGFFTAPSIDFTKLKNAAAERLSELAKFSRANLQYAIEKHKTIHLDVDMRSPYVVIPEHGTLHSGGNVLVVDFGTLNVKSELQPEGVSLDNATLSEIEAKLYDKFNIKIDNVKVLLADSGDDWPKAQREEESQYHIVPSIGMQMSFFNTVKPDYALLPKQKLIANVPTIKLQISNEKMISLYKFVMNIPFPTLPAADAVDGAPEAELLMDFKDAKMEPKIVELRRIRKSVHRNSALPAIKPIVAERSEGLSREFSTPSDRDEEYYSASDHSDEDIEEWARTIEVPTVDDHSSNSNKMEMLLRFEMGEVVILVSRVFEKHQADYLMLRINRLYADVAVTKFGLAVNAKLGGIQLVDKIHTGSSGQYLELVKSKSDADLISVIFRQVSPSCPEFEPVYRSIQQGIVARLAPLNVVFDRAAFSYLYDFSTTLQASLASIDMKSSVTSAVSSPTSTVTSAQEDKDDGKKEETPEPLPPGSTRWYIRATFEQISLTLRSSEGDLAEANIRGVESRLLLKDSRTVLNARLKDLTIQDKTKSTLYPWILTEQDDTVFDMKLTLYDKSKLELPKKSIGLDSSFHLKVGQVQIVFVYKFIVEIMGFMDPFINPEITANARLAAVDAVNKQLEDVREHGKKISLNIDMRAPKILIPQSSQSRQLFQAKLGNIKLGNSHEDTTLETGQIQTFDNMYFNLSSVEVCRAKLTEDNAVEKVHTLLQPTHMSIHMKRAVVPVYVDVLREISGKLEMIKVNLTKNDLQLLMGILNENLQEKILEEKDIVIDIPVMVPPSGAGPPQDPQGSLEPQHQESSLIGKTEANVNFVFDGLKLILSEEVEENSGDVSPGGHSHRALSMFDIGKMNTVVTVESDKTIDVQVTLDAVTLDDIRTNSTLAVKRLLQPVFALRHNISTTDPAPLMVNFKYHQDPERNKTMDIEVESIRLNVCLPYYLTVIKFFTESMAWTKTLGTSPSIESEGASLFGSRGSMDWDRRRSRRQPRLPPAEQADNTKMVVKGHVKEPEIVLFADPQDKNSKVLVLKTDISLMYDYNRAQDEMKAKASDLQIFSCMYGQRKSTASGVLKPCDIKFSRMVEISSQAVTMEMGLTSFDLSLSASTVYIILDVIDMLNSKQELSTPDPAESEETEVTESLWTVKKVTPLKWLEEDKNDGPNLFPLRPLVPFSETFKMDIESMTVMFVVENLDGLTPCLCLRTSLEMEINDWSKQLRMSAELHLDMSYYNNLIAKWEPLIEPVMEQENIYRPWEVLIKLIKAKSHPIACNYDENALHLGDSVDGELTYLMCRSKPKSDSSETDTDNETEMRVIRPRVPKKRRVSDKSLTEKTSAKNIHGESDSEPEGFIHTITSKLGSIFSSDDEADGSGFESDDEEGDEEDEEAFDPNFDKPVFITPKGPVPMENAPFDYDEVDATEMPEDLPNLCTYMVIDSRDKLLMNLTPVALNVLKDVTETLTRQPESMLKTIKNKPAFEVHNKLGLEMVLTLHKDIKACFTGTHTIYDRNTSSESGVHSSALHGIQLYAGSPDADADETDLARVMEEGDEDENDSFDEADGFTNIARALGHIGQYTMGIMTPFIVADSDSEGEEFWKHRALDRDALHMKVEGFSTIHNISHRRQEEKLIELEPMKHGQKYFIHYDVSITYGRKVVTLHSPLQLLNHLSTTLSIFCKSSDLNALEIPGIEISEKEYTKLTDLQPDDVYDIPLLVAYNCRLSVGPMEAGYQKSYSEIWWKDLVTNQDKTQYLHCLSQSGENQAFTIKVVCQSSQPLVEEDNSRMIPFYKIHLYAPIKLHNYLPYDILYSIDEEGNSSKLTQGENVNLSTVDLQKMHKLQIQLPDYHGLDWAGSLEISNDMDEFKAVVMETQQSPDVENSKHLSLSIHSKNTPAMNIFIYSAYWVINKTGLPVQLRGSGSDAVYENDTSAEPQLFRYKKYKRKKAKLRVYSSKWSHSFSLDTVGSSGVVICNDKERRRKYQFMLQIQMSRLKLTKLVTISPYFIVVNKSQRHLRYMEQNEDNDLWLDIAPEECIPFWPITELMKMCVKYQNSSVCSQFFDIKKTHTTVLRMEQGTALTVNVSGGTETPVTIEFQTYDAGDAPVRIENLCDDVFLKFNQKSQSQVTLLAPNQSMLYTWDDPTATRIIEWNLYNRKRKGYDADITRDDFGQVRLDVQTVRRSSTANQGSVERIESSPEDNTDTDADDEVDLGNIFARRTRTDKVTVYWVSYLDGLQRMLMFTQDERVAKEARKANEAEQANLALFLSLDGVGLSVINSQYEDVSFLSLSGAPALWEVDVNGKWKTLNVELASWLEDRFKNDQTQASLDDYIEADLRAMAMKKPYMGALKRTSRPAVWLLYRTSMHHMRVTANIHRLQIDNQLSDAYFPSVLYPSPLPHHVLRRSGPKPFIQFSMMRRTVPENNVDSIKYFKVLVQEFNIKVDKGFLLSISDIFNKLWKKQTEKVQLQEDLEFARRTLKEMIAVQISSESKIVFEHLHLSPLKMRISFSLNGTAHTKPVSSDQNAIVSDLVSFFLQSVGVTFTEIKEVELKMAYFAVNGATLGWNQLLSRIQSHYTSQAIQQVYVFIFGLDVLGNPYGLIKDFTQGLGDFFYEPFLGTIEGPEEFAHGLARGVESLLGHTVGGAAGSVALVTGSIGRALATMTFDEDYKKKRQQRMMQHPKSLPNSLVLAGKTFVMGVALGLSGVVLNPVQGASEDGVEGFFKGVGKGLLGLLTKPAGGVLDMVSVGFDGIRRAAEMGEDVVARIRLPRYINPTLGLKPYSPYQAVGYRLLLSLCKGKYAETDIYIAHAALSQEEKADVVVITNRRILFLEKARFWGDWNIEWDVTLDDIVAINIPDATPDKLVLKVSKDHAGFGLFTSQDRIVRCTDKNVLKWVHRKIDRAIKL